jgi:hypothetical protein
MSSYPSDFDEFLLRPSTPTMDGPSTSFDFDPSCGADPSGAFSSTSDPSVFPSMFSFTSGDSPTSSGGQSYSPPSSTTSGLPPIEEDLFAMMNGSGVGHFGTGADPFAFGASGADGFDQLGSIPMQDR